ncbi:hypothetical protein EFM19_08090, partial [Lactobacillus delbrueckii]|nr:hypothetical protein [Lactobacillus delbrueckii]
AITSSLIEYLLAKLLSFQGFIVLFGVGSLSKYFRHYKPEMYEASAENLAGGYSDPLDGWYTEEKAIYDAHGSGVTGHYTNCMDNYQYVGLVLDQSTGTSAADFGRSKDETSQSGTLVSVDEFEAALNSYVASYESALNAAKAAYDQAPSRQVTGRCC